MQIYLVIITTVLVLSQIIRVTQNYIQLNKYPEYEEQDKEVLEIYRSINKEIKEIRKTLDFWEYDKHKEGY